MLTAPFVIYRKKRDSVDDKKVPKYLTRKDLRSLGINDNFRDELVINFNNVKTKKIRLCVYWLMVMLSMLITGMRLMTLLTYIYPIITLSRGMSEISDIQKPSNNI